MNSAPQPFWLWGSRHPPKRCSFGVESGYLGFNFLSTWGEPDGPPAADSGTSPATAIVSGTAGYLMEKNQLTAARANARLRSTQTQTTIPRK